MLANAGTTNGSAGQQSSAWPALSSALNNQPGKNGANAISTTPSTAAPSAVPTNTAAVSAPQWQSVVSSKGGENATLTQVPLSDKCCCLFRNVAAAATTAATAKISSL